MLGKTVKILREIWIQQGKLSFDSSTFDATIVLGEGINVTISIVKRTKTGSQSIIKSPKKICCRICFNY